jgi:hypothetical protein
MDMQQGNPPLPKVSGMVPFLLKFRHARSFPANTHKFMRYGIQPVYAVASIHVYFHIDESIRK